MWRVESGRSTSNAAILQVVEVHGQIRNGKVSRCETEDPTHESLDLLVR